MSSLIVTAAQTVWGAITNSFLFLTGRYVGDTPNPDLASQPAKHIVILGGSFSGLSMVHRIIKQAKKHEKFKITLVSDSTHFYWSIASIRGIVPGKYTDEQLFYPIADGVKHYPKSQFEFIVGTAEKLDVKAKTVELSGSTDRKTISYDILILATGSRAREDAPFKGLESTQATKNALHDYQARIEKAATVVVAGAGVTGVEVSGEIAYWYGKQKKVTLIAGGVTVLDDCPENVLKVAVKDLDKVGVNVKLQTKVTGTAQLPNGQQEVTLSNGEKLVADMYIPTFGLVPNSSYIPSQFLNADGFVKVDQYLRVKDTEDVWALGDVCDIERPQFANLEYQAAYLSKAMPSILINKKPEPYTLATKFLGFSVGPKAGSGYWGNWKLPSFVIVWARKDLFVNVLEPTTNGKWFG